MIKLLSMKFSEYINTHHVFSTKRLLEEADSQAAAKQQLKEAVAKGTVTRVRRGLYVSHAPRFAASSADPYEIISTLDPNAILSYHSALEAHGVAHNVGFECRFRTDAARSPFSFKGIRYIPHPAEESLPKQRVRGRAFGPVYTTTREQTVFDCLKHPEWAGGIEEVIRSLSALPYLDIEKTAELALSDSASMAARVGWLLEAKSKEWRVPPRTIDLLHIASAGVTSKLGKSTPSNRGWSKKWNMCLPEAEEEVTSWAMQ